MAAKYSFKHQEEEIIVNEGESDEQRFVLFEMKASARGAYIDQARTRIDAQNRVSKMNGVESELLCKCLRTLDGKLVEAKVIQEWPGGLVADLYTRAQILNRLDGKSPAQELKNE